jgi:D-3-phosphoglycerate dehydrogenase
MRQGHWDKATHKSLELEGRTMGLVGLGAIGQRFARMVHAMGMRVIGFDPFAADPPSFVERVELDAIWRDADVISLHCPLTPENARMLDAATLARCRPGVIVVNTARGGLIDEPALLEAVRSGHVASAGLDSFQVEPIPANHDFLSEPRILLSPHIGGVTAEAYVKMGVGAVENVLRVLKG